MIIGIILQYYVYEDGYFIFFYIFQILNKNILKRDLLLSNRDHYQLCFGLFLSKKMCFDSIRAILSIFGNTSSDQTTFWFI